MSKSFTPIIIAEACQNHNGNRQILEQMINSAAECGADYIKIQAIRSKELTEREKFEQGEMDKHGIPLTIKRPYKTEKERLSKLDLSLEDERWFVERCKLAGIKSMMQILETVFLNQVFEWDLFQRYCLMCCPDPERVR